MAYKCIECGHIFEEGEQKRWREDIGEYWGQTCYEEMSGCPICEGEYMETVSCDICGSEQFEDDLCNGVCMECIDACRHDIDICHSIGEKDTEAVEINCFLASVFTREEIEKVLFDALKQRGDVDCSDFIEKEMDWFAERLLDERG